MPLSGSQQNRARLVHAAGEALVAGDGFFEVQHVANRAGVSVGLAYHRFGSKAGLIAAVVDALYDRLVEAIEIADWPTEDWPGRERERTRRFVNFVYDNPLAGIVFSKLASDPEVVSVGTARWNQVVDEGARNIAQGRARGVLSQGPDPRLLSALINGAVRHSVAHALATKPRPDREQLTAEVWSFIAGGLGIDPE